MKLITYFADKPISPIYVNVYHRTWQTIAALGDRLQKETVKVECLNEIENGFVEEMTERDFQVPKLS